MHSKTIRPITSISVDNMTYICTQPIFMSIDNKTNNYAYSYFIRLYMLLFPSVHDLCIHAWHKLVAFKGNSSINGTKMIYTI